MVYNPATDAIKQITPEVKVHIKIKNDKNQHTAFGGTFLISELCESVKIDSYIDNHLDRAGSNRGYKASEYVKSLVMGFVCGIECIMDMDHLSRDGVLKDIWKLKEIPHSSRIGDWLYRNSKTVVSNDIVSVKAVDNIGKLFRKIGYKIIKKDKEFGKKELTLDSDATYIEAKKQEVSKKSYKGFYGMSILAGFISEYGCCVDTSFRNGNISASTGLIEQLKSVNLSMKATGLKLKNYRSDAAAYKAEIINYCIEHSIHFFIRADLTNNVREEIERIPEDNWRPLYDRYGSRVEDMEIAEFIHTMNKTNESFRVIATRKAIYPKAGSIPELLGEKDYEYYSIATNSDLTNNDVYNFYNKRAICEYYIKDIKWSFSLRKLPCGSLEGNALWTNIAILAYNLLKMFNSLTGINREAKGLRFRIFSVVGRFVKHAGTRVFKLYCDKKDFNNYLIWRKICLNL